MRMDFGRLLEKRLICKNQMDFYILTTKRGKIIKYTIKNSIHKHQIPRNIANERYARLLCRKLLSQRKV